MFRRFNRNEPVVGGRLISDHDGRRGGSGHAKNVTHELSDNNPSQLRSVDGGQLSRTSSTAS